MKIAIVADPIYPVPPKAYGGTERVVYYLIKGLVGAGHEPVLFGSGDSKVDCEIMPIANKSTHSRTNRAVIYWTVSKVLNGAIYQGAQASSLPKHVSTAALRHCYFFPRLAAKYASPASRHSFSGMCPK